VTAIVVTLRRETKKEANASFSDLLT